MTIILSGAARKACWLVILLAGTVHSVKLAEPVSGSFSATNEWRQAKLRGASFRAAGQSPPWTLEIFDNNRIEFNLLDSSKSAIFNFVAPSVNRDERRIEYLVQRKLQLIIMRKACRNLKTGEHFQNAVSVHLPNLKVDGCGLHLK